MCVCVYVCIYIYIEREREREREIVHNKLCVCMLHTDLYCGLHSLDSRPRTFLGCESIHFPKALVYNSANNACTCNMHWTDRDTERDRDREKDREKDRETETQRDTERERERERDTHTHTHSDTHTHTHTEEFTFNTVYGSVNADQMIEGIKLDIIQMFSRNIALTCPVSVENISVLNPALKTVHTITDYRNTVQPYSEVSMQLH